MLDVHPPHHSPNTWRDFLLHIATIVVGLLIAVGLEQTVEWMHHSHQRHELEAQLREEGQQNAALIVTNFKATDIEIQWLLELQQGYAGHAPEG